MKAPAFLSAAASILALLSGGCIAVTKVRKADATHNPNGIRYSLPATFLVGLPKADGTIEYTTETLPDSENTYAVETYSVLAKHKVDMSLTKAGLLTQVDSTQNTADVAKALIDSAGNLAEKHFTEQKKEAKAAEDAKKAEEDAAKAKVTAATTALASAQTEEDKATDDLTKAKNERDLKPGDQAAELAVRNAEVDLARARLNREKAEAELTAAKAKLPAGAGSIAGGNVAGTEPPAAGPQAWGPVVYRVKNSPAGVQLIPVKFNTGGQTQITMATSKKIEAPKAAVAPPDLTLRGSPLVLLPADGGFGVAELKADVDLTGSVSATLLKPDGSGPAAAPRPLATRDGRGTVVILFKPDTPPGDYLLEVSSQYGASPTDDTDQYPIVVAKAPPRKP